MYIPYYNLAKSFSNILPEKWRKSVIDFGNGLKIKQNLKYIAKNWQKLQKKLSDKEKLNVAFYVYDDTKWKCQSVYDLMEQDNRFEPYIFVTKNAATNPENPSFQTIEDVKKTYKFFENKNMRVKYAYDEKNKFIPFEKMTPKPDIIIYQHPWYVETSQGPVVCSKFALTCYVPYYFPTTTAPIDYYLRFHQYVERYYIFDEITKEIYEQKMENKGKNLCVTGQPYLDYFKNCEAKEKEYIIYAPHWTVANQGISYGTFEWNGKFILEYAKIHPEQKWVFKPHPMLFKSLIDKGVMTEAEAKEYYATWDKIGLKYESGDYLELFSKSKLLITDCSSFLGEFFLTGSPVIHLISKTATPYNETINRIIKNYYRAENLEELQMLLNKLPNDDSMKVQRENAIKDFNASETTSAEKIVKDILETIGERS